MSYELSFEAPEDYETSVRVMLGVTEDELSDDDILAITIAGAAELELLTLLPNAADVLEDALVARLVKTRIHMAFICLTAFYAFPSLKVKLLQAEGDNKSTAQRFKDALANGPGEYVARAVQYLTAAGYAQPIENVVQLELSSPTVNVITGN